MTTPKSPKNAFGKTIKPASPYIEDSPENPRYYAVYDPKYRAAKDAAARSGTPFPDKSGLRQFSQEVKRPVTDAMWRKDDPFRYRFTTKKTTVIDGVEYQMSSYASILVKEIVAMIKALFRGLRNLFKRKSKSVHDKATQTEPMQHNAAVGTQQVPHTPRGPVPPKGPSTPPRSSASANSHRQGSAFHPDSELARAESFSHPDDQKSHAGSPNTPKGAAPIAKEVFDVGVQFPEPADHVAKHAKPAQVKPHAPASLASSSSIASSKSSPVAQHVSKHAKPAQVKPHAPASLATSSSSASSSSSSASSGSWHTVSTFTSSKSSPVAQHVAKHAKPAQVKPHAPASLAPSSSRASSKPSSASSGSWQTLPTEHFGGSSASSGSRYSVTTANSSRLSVTTASSAPSSSSASSTSAPSSSRAGSRSRSASPSVARTVTPSTSVPGSHTSNTSTSPAAQHVASLAPSSSKVSTSASDINPRPRSKWPTAVLPPLPSSKASTSSSSSSASSKSSLDGSSKKSTPNKSGLITPSSFNGTYGTGLDVGVQPTELSSQASSCGSVCGCCKGFIQQMVEKHGVEAVAKEVVRKSGPKQQG